MLYILYYCWFYLQIIAKYKEASGWHNVRRFTPSSCCLTKSISATRGICRIRALSLPRLAEKDQLPIGCFLLMWWVPTSASGVCGCRNEMQDFSTGQEITLVMRQILGERFCPESVIVKYKE